MTHVNPRNTAPFDDDEDEDLTDEELDYFKGLLIDERTKVRARLDRHVKESVFELDSLPDEIDQASRESEQTAMLRLAQRVGLSIPRTLVSNDPDRVAGFLEACGGRAIQKMLDSSAGRVPQPGGPDYLPTLRITEAARASLDRVAVCPMVFQEEVEKDVELRVTVVGDRLFTGAVDPEGEVDWRQHPHLVGGFVPWELDEQVGRAIGRLMDRLGLQTGTVDLIVRPNGEHVFLEVNTISFFDFLEASTGLPIADAVAGLLAADRAPR